MKISIFGAGAMGSLFAWHLTSAGAEVWAVDQWKEHVAAINQHGLIVQRHQGEEHRSRFRATTDATEVGPCDVVMIFVKYGQTAAALRAASPMIAPETTVVTLQNGIGNVELIEQQYPGIRVLFGLTTLTSELIGPGQVEASYSGLGETYLWPIDNLPNERDKNLCGLMQAGGINAMLAADIELRIWKKLVVNCCLNTLCAITNLKVGNLTDVEDSWPLLDGVVSEIVTVANARGIELNRADTIEYLRSVAGEARDHAPSMMVDLKNKRKTEIDCLNGAVLRECARLNILAPHNASLYAIIKILEDSRNVHGGAV